jgi:hypothetical protein
MFNILFYKGDFVDDQRNGNGIFYFINSYVYLSEQQSANYSFYMG